MKKSIMQKNIARLITGIFNPLIMPTLGILILFNSNSYFSMLPYDAKKVIFLTTFISTFLLPLSFLPLFIYQNIIKNISMKSKRERLLPFSVIFIMYILAYFLLKRMGVPSTINNLILGGGFTILLLIIITLKWKISAHMAGVGALTGVLFIFSFQTQSSFLVYLLLTIMVSGLVGTSRIILQSHSSAQVYTGFGLGLITIIATYLIF
jgi:hypothetical protein